MSAAAERRAAARAIRAGSRSFWLASLLLDRRTRARALALYRFCREADDAVDAAGGGDTVSAVAHLRRRLGAIEAGSLERAGGTDLAFARVLSACAIPIAVPAALIEGFAWDAARRRFEDEAALLDYARRVAGTVGLMMAAAMGVSDRAALAAACDLGCAMQLTNIARDVGEDARAGRLYLPLAWLREQGIDPDGFLRDPRFGPGLAAVIARLLIAAERLYASAAVAIGEIPSRRDRAGIRAASALYREIGRALAARGLDSVGSRTRVRAGRQLRLFAGALLAPRPLPPPRDAAAASARWDLLDAMAAAPAAGAPTRGSAPRSIDARIERIARLFDRLERADLARAAALRARGPAGLTSADCGT